MPTWQLAALRLLVAAAEECGDDHVRLQACVPYLLTALHDVSGAVRCAAVRGLVRVLGRVQVSEGAGVGVGGGSMGRAGADVSARGREESWRR